MGIEYQGKSPGKVWRLRKNSGALRAVIAKGNHKTELRSLGRNTLLSLGLAFSAGALSSTPSILAMIPLVGSLLPGALALGGFAFGYMAWRKTQALLATNIAYLYLHEAEKKWLEKKQRGPLLRRMGARVQATCRRLARNAAAPFRSAGNGLSSLKRLVVTVEAPQQHRLEAGQLKGDFDNAGAAQNPPQQASAPAPNSPKR